MKTYHLHLKRGPDGNKVYRIDQGKYAEYLEAVVSKDVFVAELGDTTIVVHPYHEPTVFTEGVDEKEVSIDEITLKIESTKTVAPEDQKTYLDFYAWVREKGISPKLKEKYNTFSPWNVSEVVEAVRSTQSQKEALLKLLGN